MIRPDLAADREFRARFRREVEAARKVSGLYTALLADADLDGPVPWLAKPSRACNNQRSSVLIAAKSWELNVSDSEGPAGQEETETSEPMMADEDPPERPRSRNIGLLSLFGFLVSAVSFSTDASFSDIASIIASRGLAVGGVVATGAAAVIVFRRLTAVAARAKAFREVRQEIDERVKVEEARKDIDPRTLEEAVNELVRLRQIVEKLERNGSRVGWIQGAVFAALTTAVAVLLIVFGRFIPLIK